MFCYQHGTSLRVPTCNRAHSDFKAWKQSGNCTPDCPTLLATCNVLQRTGTAKTEHYEHSARGPTLPPWYPKWPQGSGKIAFRNIAKSETPIRHVISQKPSFNIICYHMLRYVAIYIIYVYVDCTHMTSPRMSGILGWYYSLGSLLYVKIKCWNQSGELNIRCGSSSPICEFTSLVLWRLRDRKHWPRKWQHKSRESMVALWHLVVLAQKPILARSS